MKVIVNTNFGKEATITDCLQFLQDNGVSEIELTTDGRAHAFPWLNQDMNPATLKVVLDAYGMKCRILSGGWCDFYRGEVDAVVSQLRIKDALGADGVRVWLSNPKKPVPLTQVAVHKALRNLEIFKEDPLFFENHGGLLNDMALVDEFFVNASRSMGLTFDPANYVAAGMDPIQAIGSVWPYIKHVHVKDIDKEGNFCAVGEGVIPWSFIIGFLKEYTGYWSVEYESDETYEGKKAGILRSLNNFMELVK